MQKFLDRTEVDPSVYNEVFNADLDPTSLEELFVQFNSDFHPLFRGRSMSVSDVVVIEPEGIPMLVGEIHGRLPAGGKFSQQFTDLIAYNLKIEELRERNIDFEAHDMVGLNIPAVESGAFFCDDVGFEKIDFDERQTQKPDNLMVTFRMNGRKCIWYPGKDDSMNLLGTNRTLDTAWGDNARGKLEKGLLSRAGWSIIDESPSATRGDGSTTFALQPDTEGFPWWAQPVDKTATDWYFLGYGHDYKGCLADYIKVGGRVPLPPKYIFGYWYSRYWAYTQAEFMQIIREVEKNDIPMDVLIMDMDWHKSGWTGWSWNKQLISSPISLIRYMHTHGLKTALNLHPADGIGNHEDYYAAMKKDLGYTSSYTERIPWAIEDTTFTRAFFKNICS